MTQILIVTPLQEEYTDLHKSLSVLGLKAYTERIGRLDVYCYTLC